MKKFFQLALALLGCLHLTAGPYALVQMIAWGGMLVTYSQTSGLAQATIDTFSGEKPCDMCDRIADARNEGKGQAPGSSEKSAPNRASHDLFPTESIGINPPPAVETTIVVLLPPLEGIGLDAAPPLLQPPKAA